MKDRIASFLHDERGATAAEYAIMASLIAVVIIGAVTLLGLATNALFNEASTEFEKIEP